MKTRKFVPIVAVSLSVAAIAVALLAGGPAPGPTPAKDAKNGVVARVNGVEFGERQLRWQMERLFPYYQIHGGRVPESLESEVRQKALSRLVLEELVLQEAKRRNLSVPEVEVQQRLASIRQPYGDEASFQKDVGKKYGSLEEMQRHVREVLLIERLWQQEVNLRAQVTEAEVQSFYENNQSKFVRPEGVWLQSISFLVPAGAARIEKRLVRERAEALLSQARSARSFQAFGRLAERYSQDDWRVMNGDHGWMHRGTLDPELQPVFNLKTGEITGVVESRSGFHILRVNGRRSEAQLPFAEVREKIRKTLEQQKRQQLGQSFEQRLREKARIEMP